MKIVDSKLVQYLYKIKVYFDLGISQISWFTGKLPEIMGMLYILEKFHITIDSKYIIYYGIIAFVSVTVFGYFMKRSGLWIRERKVSTNIDPIQKEIYEAAKKINQEK